MRKSRELIRVRAKNTIRVMPGLTATQIAHVMNSTRGLYGYGPVSGVLYRMTQDGMIKRKKGPSSHFKHGCWKTC